MNDLFHSSLVERFPADSSFSMNGCEKEESAVMHITECL